MVSQNFPIMGKLQIYIFVMQLSPPRSNITRSKIPFIQLLSSVFNSKMILVPPPPLPKFLLSNRRSRVNGSIREVKFDVTWSYVKRQTAKMTSEFVFFSSNPPLNDIKIEKCLLLFAANTNIFTLQFKELKTDGKSFIFAV